MADLEWSFEVTGNAKEQLDLVDKALVKLPPDLEKVEAELAKLDRAAAASRIGKIQDPLKQNRALLELHAKDLRAAGAAADAMAAKEKAAGDAAAKAAAQAAHGGGSGVAGDIGKGALEGAGLGGMLKLGTAAGAAQAAVSAVVDAVKAAVSEVIDLGTEFVKLGIDSSEAYKRQVGSLAGLEGAAAEQTVDALDTMANAAGRDGDRALEAFKGLRNAGFDTAESMQVLAASSDIKWNSGGRDAAAQAFEDVFAKIKTLGKVGSKDLAALRDSGIELPKLADALGGRIGKSAEEAMKLLQKGDAKSVDVQNALLDVVQDLDGGGALGDLAKSKSLKDVDAQLGVLKDAAGDLFQKVDASPIAHAMSTISALLNGEMGDRLKAVIGQAFTGIATTLDGIDFEKWLGKGVSFIETARDAFVQFTAGLAPAGGALEHIGEIMSAVDGSLGSNSTSWQTLGTVVGDIAVVIAAVVAPIVLVVDALSSLYGWITKVSDALGGAIGDTFAELFGKGKDASDGMAEGLRAGQPNVEAAAADMANAVPKTVETNLDIHSPSRVLQDLGIFTGEGFKLGIDESDPMSALDFGLSAPSFEGVAGNTNGGSITWTGDLIVPDAGNPEATARAVRLELASYFDELQSA